MIKTKSIIIKGRCLLFSLLSFFVSSTLWSQNTNTTKKNDLDEKKETRFQIVVEKEYKPLTPPRPSSVDSVLDESYTPILEIPIEHQYNVEFADRYPRVDIDRRIPQTQTTEEPK